MWRDLAQPSHLLIIAVLLVILFGWKKLPDAARSVGRSMRIFKSEVSEMKNDGKDGRPSPAASDTVPGDVVPPQPAAPQAQQYAPQSQPQSQPQYAPHPQQPQYAPAAGSTAAPAPAPQYAAPSDPSHAAAPDPRDAPRHDPAL